MTDVTNFALHSGPTTLTGPELHLPESRVRRTVLKIHADAESENLESDGGVPKLNLKESGSQRNMVSHLAENVANTGPPSPHSPSHQKPHLQSLSSNYLQSLSTQNLKKTSVPPPETQIINRLDEQKLQKLPGRCQELVEELQTKSRELLTGLHLNESKLHLKSSYTASKVDSRPVTKSLSASPGGSVLQFLNNETVEDKPLVSQTMSTSSTDRYLKDEIPPQWLIEEALCKINTLLSPAGDGFAIHPQPSSTTNRSSEQRLTDAKQDKNKIKIDELEHAVDQLEIQISANKKEFEELKSSANANEILGKKLKLICSKSAPMNTPGDTNRSGKLISGTEVMTIPLKKAASHPQHKVKPKKKNAPARIRSTKVLHHTSTTVSGNELQCVNSDAARCPRVVPRHNCLHNNVNKNGNTFSGAATFLRNHPEFKKLKAEVQSLTSQLCGMCVERGECRRQIDELKAAIDDRDLSLKEYCRRFSNLEERYKATRIRLQRCEDEKCLLEEMLKISTTVEETSALKKRIQYLSSRLQAAHHQLSVHSQLTNELKGQSVTQQQCINNLQSRIHRSENMSQNRLQLIDTYKVRFMTITEKLQIAERRNYADRLEIQSLKTQISSLKQRLSNAVNEKKIAENKYKDCQVDKDQQGNIFGTKFHERRSAVSAVDLVSKESMKRVKYQCDMAMDKVKEKLRASEYFVKEMKQGIDFYLQLLLRHMYKNRLEEEQTCEVCAALKLSTTNLHCCESDEEELNNQLNQWRSHLRDIIRQNEFSVALGNFLFQQLLVSEGKKPA